MVKEHDSKYSILFKTRWRRLKRMIGEVALHYGIRDGNKMLLGQSDRNELRYWREKVSNPNFHRLQWGGARNFRFSDIQNAVLEATVLGYIRDCYRNRLYTLTVKIIARDINFALAGFGFPRVTIWKVKKILKDHDLSWKYCTTVIRNKFNEANMTYYHMFWNWMQGIFASGNSFRLKFQDEVGMEVKKSRSKMLSQKNVRIITPVQSNNVRRVSLSLITSLVPSNVGLFNFVSSTEGTNTGFTFIQSVIMAIQWGFIRLGDILVLDNAAIHHAAHVVEALQTLCLHVGFQVVFLPTYSPELNPCELMFNDLKRNLVYSTNAGGHANDAIQFLQNYNAFQIWQKFRHCYSQERNQNTLNIAFV